MIHCRTTLSIAMLTFFVSSNANARVAGTMNFKNITATNVQQTVNETSGNEKEVNWAILITMGIWMLPWRWR